MSLFHPIKKPVFDYRLIYVLGFKVTGALMLGLLLPRL